MDSAGQSNARFDPQADSSLGAALARLLSDATLRDRLRQAGQARAAEFLWSDAARKLHSSLQVKGRS
jgi:glycosyltransferase involved in cell wall biosynthesis